MRVMIAIVIAVFLLCGCAFGLLSLHIWQQYTAAQQAAMPEPAASEAGDSQSVTAVCVGLNIGSCRTEQEQTGTPTQTERRDAGGNPWPVIVLSTVMLLIAQYLVINAADPWGARGRQ
jgi:hypothetical protein